MRLLLPLLLLAGVVVGILFLRSGSQEPPGATGPTGQSAPTGGERVPVDLARGADADGRMSAAGPGTAGSTAAQATQPASDVAPETVNPGPAKEPGFEGDATTSPVGDAVAGAGPGAYAAKYQGSSTTERAAALESLRITLELESTAGAKNAVEWMAEMKREMEWLQASLDG